MKSRLNQIGLALGILCLATTMAGSAANAYVCALIEVDLNQKPMHTTKEIPENGSVTGDWYPDIKAIVSQTKNGNIHMRIASGSTGLVYADGFGQISASVTAPLERDDNSKQVNILCNDFSRRSVLVSPPAPGTPPAASSPASPAATSGVEIKPLATVCNLTPQYQNIDLGEFTYKDDLGGFPNDRMTELCRSKGGSHYQTTSIDVTRPGPWLWQPRFEQRTFTYRCYARQPVAATTCEVLARCKTSNVIAENIASIDHWLNDYKCKSM